MHGVRRVLLERQAAALGLALDIVTIPPQCINATYEARMAQTLQRYKDRGVQHAAFGDIFLEDLASIARTNLARIGMKLSSRSGSAPRPNLRANSSLSATAPSPFASIRAFSTLPSPDASSTRNFSRTCRQPSTLAAKMASFTVLCSPDRISPRASPFRSAKRSSAKASASAISSRQTFVKQQKVSPLTSAHRPKPLLPLQCPPEPCCSRVRDLLLPRRPLRRAPRTRCRLRMRFNEVCAGPLCRGCCHPEPRRSAVRDLLLPRRPLRRAPRTRCRLRMRFNEVCAGPLCEVVVIPNPVVQG